MTGYDEHAIFMSGVSLYLGGRMVSEEARRRLRRTVSAHALHTSIPVPVRQLVTDLGWLLQFRERIYPLCGFAVKDGPAKVMVLNASNHPWYQRYVMAHEIAHENNGDLSSIDLIRSDQSHIHIKQERAADIVAAHILIPDFALYEYETYAEVAAACQVPVDLVRLRLSARIDFGDPHASLISAWG